MPLLINFLVLCIVCAIVYWIWTLLPFGQPLKNILLAILLLILLIYVLTIFPGIGWHYPLR